jgi:pimeloyl-ACP methyl ester carboxylesterase
MTSEENRLDAWDDRLLSYERDGLRLAYHEIGEGAPLLFVHGATGTGKFDWGELAAALSPQYRCIVPDLRGHGQSGFREPGYERAAIIADLLTLVHYLDADRPHVIGFSYGAETALRLEIEVPGTARSLVLVSPGTGIPSGQRAPGIEYLHRIWPRPLRRLHEPTHGPDHWRTLVALLQQHAASDGEVPPAALAAVGCPVLLLAGDHDYPPRRLQGKRFAEVNPRARYVEIAGAGHAAHLDRPADVARVVSDFLAQADGRARPAPTATPAGQPTNTPTDQES